MVLYKKGDIDMAMPGTKQQSTIASWALYGFFAFILLFSQTPAKAETLTITPSEITVSTDGYAKAGDSVTINYNIPSLSLTDDQGQGIITNKVDSGQIKLNCNGYTDDKRYENAGYEQKSAEGLCWGEQEYTRVRDINGFSVTETMKLSAQPLSGTFSATATSQCTGNKIQGAGDIKRWCTFEAKGLTGNTGDDMFRLDPNGYGYLEYLGVTNGDDSDLNAKKTA